MVSNPKTQHKNWIYFLPNVVRSILVHASDRACVATRRKVHVQSREDRGRGIAEWSVAKVELCDCASAFVFGMNASVGKWDCV